MKSSPFRLLLSHARFRRAAIIAGKATAGTAAAGIGLTLGLGQIKRGLHAEEPLDLWLEAAFDLRTQGERVDGHDGLRDPQRLAELAEIGGFQVSEFQAAAQSLRPVEMQLEELQVRLMKEATSSPTQRPDEIAALATQWRERGYFGAEVPPQGIFGRRNTSDAQGVDIGARVPTYLIPVDGVPSAAPVSWGLDGATREAALASLQHWGCTLLRNAITQEDLLALRTALGLGQGAGTRRAGQVGQWILQRDPNIAMGRYTFGRLHCLLRGSPVFEPDVVAPHSVLAPLVHSFFRTAEANGQRVFLSEAQLIIADPCAEAQFWHLEGVGGPGLTAMIPLVNVALDRGPQELLPGTHWLQDRSLPLRERLRRCLAALSATHGAVNVTGKTPWAAGDALVMDRRLLHRGMSNDSLGAPIPVLVLRYDLVETPAPGCGRVKLLAASRLGSAISAAFRLYAAA